MTGVARISARAMRPLALAQIRHVTPVRPGEADGLTAQVYRSVEREFGVLVPPVALHSPAPETLAAAWLMLRETLLAPGLVDRAVREAVASAVSVANACPYCVSVHSATLHGLAGGRDARTIAAGQLAEVTEPRLRAAATWATATARRPRPDEAPHVPFTREQAPEYAGVAVVFHYLNRMVNTFLEDAPMPPNAPRAGLPVVERVLSALIRATGRRIGAPGAALDLLPPAPVPDDLGWARPNPAITQAFARAGAAVDRAARHTVPPAVRELLATEIETWDGQPRGLSRSWVEPPLTTLPPADRPAGRLALLVAFASHQIDPTVIEAYRKTHQADADLVTLASWAALSAARRTATWLPVPPAPENGPGPHR
ncbi:carboxymuconolactone decarboxylase family protein [Streptomyces sp. NPDC049954]|uniref:carboxymuconolactone decarboxylase family protein n=1 Tax=Streptomyces sp. NPDC049954 TaxID=3155779 RepID=UPI00343A1861